MTAELVTPVPAAAAQLPRAWWNGCWLEPGHFLFDPRGRKVWGGDASCPVSAAGDSWWLDARLAPRRLLPGARLPETFAVPPDRIVFARMAGDDRHLQHRLEVESEECPQGDFLLHSIAGCTIAAWWDRTQGDERRACNSCLIIDGHRDAPEVLELFPRLFPRQAERLEKSGVQLRFLRWAT